MEKIDIHDTENNYREAIECLKKDLSSKNYDLITSFLEASAIGRTAKKNARKKQVGMRARLKNLYLLKAVANFFNKDLDKINLSDMEKFVKSLNENKIKKYNKDSYSEQTKANMKVTFINFLRYIIKDSSKLAELTDWIETSFKKKEIPALNEDEIKKLISVCYTPQQRALIAFMFDSGARAEELLNIRLSDVTEVKGDISYYRVLIRNEFSKTQGRHISLFWKPTTAILRTWLEEHPDKHKLDSQLFPNTYDGLRKLLYKLGMRAFKKSVNPHLFRHSSATYYASIGTDYFQLCKRYGWAIGSDMPQRYIDRSGIGEKEQTEKFIKTNVKELNEELELIKRKSSIEKEESNSQIKALTELSKLLIDEKMGKINKEEFSKKIFKIYKELP